MAVVVLGVMAASASAFDYEVSVSTSDGQAGAHPDLTLGAAFASAPGISNLRFTLPDGLAIAPAAVGNRCSTALALAGSCGLQAKIGAVEVQSENLGAGSGDVFLTEPPATGDSAGVAIIARFADNDAVVALGSLRFVVGSGGGMNEEIEFADLPLASENDEPLELTNVSLFLNGAIGEPSHALVTNPSSCPGDPAIIASTAADHGGVVSTAFAEYPVSGCEQVAFSPVVDSVFSNPSAGQPTSADFELALPLDQSSVQSLSLFLPTAIWLNTPAFGGLDDMCPADSIEYQDFAVFRSTGCPEQAQIGSVHLTTPLLMAPIEGAIYVVDQSPLFALAVEFEGFEGLLNVGLVPSWPKVVASCNRLMPGGCMVRMLLAFDAMPQLPLTGMDVSLGKAGRTSATGNPLPADILRVAPPSARECVSPGAARAVVVPWSGETPTTINDAVAFSGCQGSATPPNTTITSAPEGEIAEASPTIEFTSNAPNASFKCKVDGADYSTCVSPFIPPALSDGSHRVRVRAVTSAGADPTPAEASFVVNTSTGTLPAPTILSAPGPTSPDTSARFEFSGEAGHALECSVDSANWRECESPFDVDQLTDGEHTFAVRHVVSEGDPALEANWSWVVNFEPNVCPVPQREPKILGGGSS